MSTHFPAYSYVPGLFPHPIREVGGHSYGHAVKECDPADLRDWRECGFHREGTDLFNHGYYWEAHECWEAVWVAAGRSGSLADLLKGLIKLAAAGVKAREGRSQGVRRHVHRAAALFQSVATDIHPERVLFGVEVVPLVGVARELERTADQVLNPSTEPVVVVFPFTLQLQDNAGPSESATTLA